MYLFIYFFFGCVQKLENKNLCAQQKKKRMWFQTLLLTTLSLAQYGKFMLSMLGRCNRSLRIKRPESLYVRINSVQGAWLAAFLKEKQLARQVCVVEEEDTVMVEGIHEEDLLTLDAAFRCTNVNTEWKYVSKPPPSPENKGKEDWALFGSTTKTTTTVDNEEQEDSESSEEIGILQPEEGWQTVYNQLKDQLQMVESLPEHELISIIDARNTKDADFDETTLRQALRILGVLNLEIDLLGMDYMFESMEGPPKQSDEVVFCDNDEVLDDGTKEI